MRDPFERNSREQRTHWQFRHYRDRILLPLGTPDLRLPSPVLSVSLSRDLLPDIRIQRRCTQEKRKIFSFSPSFFLLLCSLPPSLFYSRPFVLLCIYFCIVQVSYTYDSTIPSNFNLTLLLPHWEGKGEETPCGGASLFCFFSPRALEAFPRMLFPPLLSSLLLSLLLLSLSFSPALLLANIRGKRSSRDKELLVKERGKRRKRRKGVR